MGLTAAVCGFVVLFLSVSGTVHLHLHFRLVSTLADLDLMTVGLQAAVL